MGRGGRAGDGGSWAETAVQEEAKEVRAVPEAVGDWTGEGIEAAERISEMGEVSRTPRCRLRCRMMPGWGR